MLKPDPELLHVLWPFTADTDNTMNQTELKANACTVDVKHWKIYMKSAWLQLLLVPFFSLLYKFLFNQLQSEVIQNQCKCE